MHVIPNCIYKNGFGCPVVPGPPATVKSASHTRPRKADVTEFDSPSDRLGGAAMMKTGNPAV